MELQAHYEARFRIVISLDQAISRESHGLEARSQPADPLMMVAIHSQSRLGVPRLQRASGNDRDPVPIRIVMVIVDVLQARLLFLLDVTIESASADHVHKLRA